MAEPQPAAVVTGAASGIGRAIAVRLGKLGYRLILVDQDHAGLQNLAAELSRAALAEHELVAADVTNAEAWQGLAETLRHDDTDIALLVQAAGILLAGKLADCEPADLDRIVRVNLTGALLGARAIGPLLSATPGSKPPPLPRGVLNVASIFGAVSPPGFTAYNATKAGLVALTETLRGEWAPLGLTATAVLPGVTRTGLFDKATYADQRIADLVATRATEAELSADQVAEAALKAYRHRRVVVPIGRRARRLFWIKRWLPKALLERVAKEANRELG